MRKILGETLSVVTIGRDAQKATKETRHRDSRGEARGRAEERRETRHRRCACFVNAIGFAKRGRGKTVYRKKSRLWRSRGTRRRSHIAFFAVCVWRQPTAFKPNRQPADGREHGCRKRERTETATDTADKQEKAKRAFEQKKWGNSSPQIDQPPIWRARQISETRSAIISAGASQRTMNE